LRSSLCRHRLTLGVMYKRESVSQVAVLGSPAYAVTSEIAAEGEIVNATPLGSDPHYMEFTSSVARVLEQSKAVIALGASADRKWSAS